MTSNVSSLHQEALLDFVLIRTDQVDLGERLRPIDPVWAEALGQIMLRDGQDTPIVVCRLPGRSRWTVVAGGHRHAAAVRAEIEYLRAEIVSADRDDRKLREVRENIWRADLAPIDRAAFVAEAVAIFKRRAGIDPAADGRAASAAARWKSALKAEATDATATIAVVYGWSKDVGEQIGLSERTVRDDLMLYHRLAPSLVEKLRAIRHPVLSNATQLRTLAKLDEHAQAQAVELLTVPGASLNYGQPKTVAEAIAHPLGPKPAGEPVAPDKKRYSTILNTLKSMSAAELKDLFQSPQFHALIPAQARALLAPMRVDPKADADANENAGPIPSDRDSAASGISGHGAPSGARRADAQREHGVGIPSRHRQLSDTVAVVRGPRILGGAAAAAEHLGGLIALVHDHLSQNRDADWIVGQIAEHGGVSRFAHGTYELRLAKVTATCTGGGAGLLSAWLNAAERRIAQMSALGLAAGDVA